MIDERGFPNFLERLRSGLRAALPGYEPADDVGRGLAAIHAHYLEILVDRLNRVPAKDRAAFLDLVGVSRLAPAAARVPVTFTLAPGAPPAPVEPGTQLATQQTATLPAVVFETEARMNLVAAELLEAHVVDPTRDAWTGATGLVTGAGTRPFAVFRGERPLLHALHLGHARLLDLKRPATLVLDLGVQPPAGTVWEASTESGWTPLTVAVDGTRVRVDPFAGAAPLTLRGAGLDGPRPGRWLRWRLDRPLTHADTQVRLGEIVARVLREDTHVELSDPLPAGPRRRVVPSAVDATQLTQELRASMHTVAVAATRGFTAGDLVLIGEDEVARATAVGEAGITLTRTQALDHPAGTALRRFDPALVPDGLEPGDWLRAGDRAARVVAIDAGVPPDHVLVNAVPADASKPFAPFGETPKLGDALQLASADAFAKPDPSGTTEVTIDVTVRLADAELRWRRFDHGPTVVTPDEDTTHGFTRDGVVVFRTIGADEFGDGNVHIVAVTLAAGGYQRVPAITALRVNGAPAPALWTSPAFGDPRGSAKLTALDPGDAFLPFGSSPVPGATLYVGVPNGADEARIEVTLAPPPRLAWEYLSARGWMSLDVSDATAAFTRSGDVTFAVPSDLVPIDLNGVVAPWVRARIAAGAYGRPVELVMVDPSDPKAGFTPRQGSGALNAPLVSRLAIRYASETGALERVTRNDFHWAAGGVTPFAPVSDAEPALYLRFDAPLPDSGARLYAVTPPRQFTETFAPPPAATEEDAQLVWELWDGRAWAPLTIADHTALLTESGAIEIIGVRELGARSRTRPDLPAGEDPAGGYWVRVRRAAGGPEYQPALTHLLLNTVEAVQATTVRDEILGSSDGRRGATFRTARRPVLPGQVVVVREPERPPQPERAGAAEPAGEQAPFDVVWTEVPTLAASRPTDRHYTIERLTGTVRFGDGRHGLIPPAGSDNVVCRVYRAGGGAEGNQPAGAVAQLRSSIPYVAAVANPVPAGGGSAPEGEEPAARRGPQTLRHRDRAVSADDFEWLALEAAGTGVARARALPNRDRELRFTPGWTTVVIVPESDDRRPLPSAELVRTVQTELDRRCLATLSAGVSCVNVIAPGYVPVDVHAVVVPRDLGEGEATRRDVLQALEDFLHPLRGGPDGAGWPLGRDVYLSELYAALERIARVDYVAALELRPSAGALALRAEDPVVAATGYPAGSLVTVGEDVVARLGQAIGPGTPVDGVQAVLFQEGERVRIGTAETIVRTITGAVLDVDPFLAGAGERVVACEHIAGPAAGVERGAALAEPVVTGTLVERLRVRLPAHGDPLVVRRADGVALALTVAPALDQRLRIADSQLPYSGLHQVDLRGPEHAA